MYVRVTARQNSDFLRHSVDSGTVDAELYRVRKKVPLHFASL